MGLVTVSPVITAFHSCCLSHHVFDQVNLWPAWVGFETAIFWQCSHGTVETKRLYPLRYGPRSALWRSGQKKNLPRWGQKCAIDKKLILRLRSVISKWFQLKTITVILHVRPSKREGMYHLIGHHLSRYYLLHWLLEYCKKVYPQLYYLYSLQLKRTW